MQLSQLEQEMSGPTITNGWDAVVAMNLDVVNALFEQQYVTDFMAGARQWLQIAGTTAAGETVLMVGEIGPPLVSFAASNQVTLSMQVVDGRVVVVDDAALVYSLTLPTRMCVITGTVPIVAGSITGSGSVVADFTGGTYTLSPATLLTADVSSALNDAIQAYFQQSGVKYTLGSIDGTNAQKPLLPVDFTIATQASDEPGEAAVLLLVNTGDGDGTPGALPYYPIPDGSTASIVINRSVIFGMIQSAISSDLPSTIGANNDGEYQQWYGTINAGRVATPDYSVWTNDLSFNNVNLSLTPNTDGAVGATLKVSIEMQGGCLFNYSAEVYPHLDSSGSVIGVIGASGQLQIEPVVAADGSLAFQYSNQSGGSSLLELYGWWFDLAGNRLSDDLFGDETITVLNTIYTAVQSATNLAVNSLQLPAINVFALQSLVFPEQAPLTIQNGYLINDLLLTCNIAPQLTVAPATAPVAPGGTVQFTATQGGSAAAAVTWSAVLGSIDSNGNYTAPTTDANGNPLRHSTQDQITAMLSSNNDIAGDAIAVVLAEGSANFLSPVAAQVTPGSSLPLAAMDANGNPMTVSQWTLSPNAGNVVSGTGAGMYVYTAPTVGSGTVTITGQATEGGSGSIQVGIGTTPLQVSTPNPALQPGQTYTLTASGGTSGAPYLWWVTGGGTVVPNVRNSATATYTAPGTLNGPVTVMVCQPDTGAFGTIALSSSNWRNPC